MPTFFIERPPEISEAMRLSLNRHIMRERQKKKQEQEADAEVERQRKEKERQQNQDKMTLGETREQIAFWNNNLSELKERKHELFLQLKKVLNEDDNRRRQLVKESNEVMELYTSYQPVPIANPQPYLQQNMPVANRSPLYKLLAPQQPMPPAGPLKRRRTPSPATYPQYGAYKPSTSQPPYQKVDENRRSHPDIPRAVLWNRSKLAEPYGMAENSQYGPFYSASTTVSYSAAPTPSQTVYTYGGPHFQSAAGGAPPPPPQIEPPNPPPKHHYLTQQRPHNPYGKPTFSEENFYAGAQIRPATHVPLHGGAIPIQQPPQGAKTGGITSGYPIRPPPSAPTATTPHSVYVSQPSGSRMVYSQPGTSSQSAGLSGIRYSVPPMQREA